MATTRQKVEQGARSREALLDAAISLIAEGGYTATGVDAIARRSGVVKSALYWHFGSKDGLLVAALERTAREWAAELEAAGVETDTPEQHLPAQHLDRLIDRVRDLFLQRQDRVRLLMAALIERGSSNDEVRAGVARILDVMRAEITRAMRSLPSSSERIAAISTITLQTFAGAFLEDCANPDPVAFDERLEVFREMVALFVASERSGAAGR